MKIKILGTTYKIKKDDSIIEENADGICKAYEKKILIISPHKMLCKDAAGKAKNKRYKEVLRHEIVHAFFNESGLEKYSQDEELVNWIAVQFPKLSETFKKVKCI
ncbi:MAG: hypothetical protein K2I03_08485 [Lachnospiraceae bacterium]|nr:hypothetical protein [Lachnospiraceae bacterium]